jgi:tight adherence protein B
MTRLGIVLLAAAASTAVATPTYAAEHRLDVSDAHVDASLTTVDLTVTAQQLPADVGLDPGSVAVTVDGRALPTTAVVAASATSVSAPRVLLAVDNSGSMLGAPLDEAKAALTSFISSAPTEAELGLLTFSTTNHLVVEPTLDRTRLLGAVTEMRAQGETAVYDATIAATAALGTSGDRRVVVLSDGGDTVSAVSVESAADAVRAAGVSLDAIGFRTEESVEGALQLLADAGNGEVHSVQTLAGLSAALTTTSRPHARALALHVLVPEDLRGDRELAIEVGTSLGPLVSSIDVSLGAVETDQATGGGWWGTRDALIAGVGAIGLSLLLGSLVLAGANRDRRRVQHVLDRYTTAPAVHGKDLRTDSPVTRTALQVAERVATSRDLKDRLGQRLERASVALAPAEWLLLQAGVVVVVGLLLAVLGMHVLVALLAGGASAWVGPTAYLGVRGSRRQRAFEDRLPDALQAVAGSLAAGYSLAQALDGVVREGSQPLAAEFGKALAESRLGVPVETTLQGVSDRMASRDFGWVVMAIRVQREVGGNLAGILTTVAATMRERSILKRHVRALSAEGRLSAYILLGLPVALALYMLVARPQYIEPLFTTPIGLAMVAGAAVLMTVGTVVMKRMVIVEV